MTTMHLVDPQLLPVPFPPEFEARSDTLDQIRQMAWPAPDPEAIASLAELRVVDASAEHGPQAALRVFRPQGRTTSLRPAIYHIHGGGYLVGSAADVDLANASRAARHGAVVVSVDYRLAPETSFPGAIEDCYNGLAWLIRHADDLGVDARRIVVTGESAGGGLAAALTHLVRDRALCRLAGQLLVYPMLDDRTGGPDDPYRNATTGEFMWTRSSNQFGWRSLQGGAAVQPDALAYFAPARASRFDDLPPCCLLTAALDLFLDENLSYATALSRAGVSLSLRVYPGAYHGFNIVADAEVTGRYLRDEAEGFDWLLQADA